MRGCLRESRYVEEGSDLKLQSVRFFNEDQIAYIDDSMGYHKIGNPNRDTGSVSMHLYTPPFSTCKVWMDPSRPASEFEIVRSGYFSIRGHRSPSMEGVPGNHAKLMQEIKHNKWVRRCDGDDKELCSSFLTMSMECIPTLDSLRDITVA